MLTCIKSTFLFLYSKFIIYITLKYTWGECMTYIVRIMYVLDSTNVCTSTSKHLGHCVILLRVTLLIRISTLEKYITNILRTHEIDIVLECSFNFK